MEGLREVLEVRLRLMRVLRQTVSMLEIVPQLRDSMRNWRADVTLAQVSQVAASLLTVLRTTAAQLAVGLNQASQSQVQQSTESTPLP